MNFFCRKRSPLLITTRMPVVDKQTFAILLLGFSICHVMQSTDINDFFPEIHGNLTNITWAHAVNNQSYLAATLVNRNVNMIEADISFGKLNDAGVDIPIMAHPPAKISDLSLEEFLAKVNESNVNGTNSKKGVKLDFKTIDVFENSVDIVRKFVNEGYPIWLNADILPGPINSTTTPVNSTRFLEKAKTFSNSVLSIGWTTYYTSDGSKENGSYTDQQITDMLSVIKSNNVTQNITFPVRAGLAAESVDQMKHLLDSVPNSTLTIWQSGANDTVDVKKLKQLISTSGLDRTYIDVPEYLLDELRPLNNHGIKNMIPSVLILAVFLLFLMS